MITKQQLLMSLAYGWPNSPWTLPNDWKDFDKEVIWHDKDSSHPTYAQIEEYYKSIDYIAERRANYPSFEDQFDILYHSGFDGWWKVIDDIKQKFPKP